MAPTTESTSSLPGAARRVRPAPPARSSSTFARLAPDADDAMRGLRGAVWLEPRLRELVEARTAQLDGSVDEFAAHAREALGLGESQARLAALGRWRRSRLFSPRERAALALADALARSDRAAVLAARRRAAGLFDERELAQVVFACVAAAACDRLALAAADPWGL